MGAFSRFLDETRLSIAKLRGSGYDVAVPKPLRLAIISDIHHEVADVKPKMCSAGLPLLRDFAKFCSEQQVNGVIDLGDRIDDRDRERDCLRAREVAEVFRTIAAPRDHVMGNHDSYHLNRSEWESLLDAPLHSHSKDAGGVHLVFFSPDVNNERGKFPYSAAAEDLSWLESDLAATNLPSIVFTHVPFIAGKMVNHYYFENKEGRAEFLNSSRLRHIVESSGKVLLVCSGHVHWNSLHTSNGVHYVTIQSLTESFTTHPAVAAAYAILEVNTEIAVTVFGNDPLGLRLPMRRRPGGWLRP